MQLQLIIAWDISARMVQRVLRNRMATLVSVLLALRDSGVRLTLMNAPPTHADMGSALIGSTSTFVTVIVVTRV